MNEIKQMGIFILGKYQSPPTPKINQNNVIKFSLFCPKQNPKGHLLLTFPNLSQPSQETCFEM